MKRDSVIKKSLATILVVSTVCTSASCGMLNPSLKAKKEAADSLNCLRMKIPASSISTSLKTSEIHMILTMSGRCFSTASTEIS